jgi:hypothetical protein
MAFNMKLLKAAYTTGMRWAFILYTCKGIHEL